MDAATEPRQARGEGRPIKVVVTYWHGTSRHAYCDDDVVRLYDQLRQHVSELEFVVYADAEYDVPGRIERLERPGSYQSAVECYKEAGPFMYLGLDTVIRGNLDDVPFDKLRSTKPKTHPRINVGVVLVPAGPNTIYSDYKWVGSDMPHVRQYVEETLPPERFASYKFDDWKNADIVYFHGQPKPRDVNWLQ